MAAVRTAGRLLRTAALRRLVLDHCVHEQREMRAGKPWAPGMSKDTRYQARGTLAAPTTMQPEEKAPPIPSVMLSGGSLMPKCLLARSPPDGESAPPGHDGDRRRHDLAPPRHRRGAAPSSHEPGQPPPRLHVAAPRPAQPTPHPRPRSGPGAKEARHDRTSTQGRTQFVACGRDSPAPEPFGERVIPAPQGRDPATADRGPLRAASPSSAPPSAHPPRASPWSDRPPPAQRCCGSAGMWGHFGSRFRPV